MWALYMERRKHWVSKQDGDLCNQTVWTLHLCLCVSAHNFSTDFNVCFPFVSSIDFFRVDMDICGKPINELQSRTLLKADYTINTNVDCSFQNKKKEDNELRKDSRILFSIKSFEELTVGILKLLHILHGWLNTYVYLFLF